MARTPQSFARPSQAVMRALVLRALLVIVAGAAAISSAPAAEPVKVDVAFSGLWWTHEQVLELATTNPRPPRTTRATIKEWDAGDPDWPPHPATVDVDITVAAGVAIKEPIEISFQYREKGRLTAPKTIVRSVIDLAAGATQVLHGSVAVLDHVHYRPDLLKVTTTIGKRPPVMADLPIILPY